LALGVGVVLVFRTFWPLSNSQASVGRLIASLRCTKHFHAGTAKQRFLRF
jgi:hypothetical protein